MIYFCPCLEDSSIEALETVPTVDVGIFSLDTIMMRFPSAEETLSYLHQLKQIATAVLKEDLSGILEVYSIVANALFEKKPSLKSIKCAYILFLMRKEDFFFSERTVALFAELGLYISRLEIHYLLCAVFCGEYAQRRPVLLRYNQLTDISSDIDKASIAIFIEKMIKSVEACANMHFKKGVYNIPRAHEIPCSISYVGASKEVYILLEKKSAYAFRIPSDPQIAVSTVVRHSSTTNLETLRIQESFSGEKGVWPVLGSITYAKSPDMFRKAIWFTPLPQCTLLQVSTGEVTLPIEILLEIIEQLAHGLAALHREGYRYGDIDAKNAFFL